MRLRWSGHEQSVSQDDGTNRVPIVIFIGVALCLVIVWLVIQMGVRRPRRLAAGEALRQGRVHRLVDDRPVSARDCVSARQGREPRRSPTRTPSTCAPASRAICPTMRAPAGIVLYAGSYDLRFEPGLSVAGDPRPRRRRRRRPPRRGSRDPRSRCSRSSRPAPQSAGRARGRSPRSTPSSRPLRSAEALAFIRTNRPPLADANGDLLGIDEHRPLPPERRGLRRPRALDPGRRRSRRGSAPLDWALSDV